MDVDGPSERAAGGEVEEQVERMWEIFEDEFGLHDDMGDDGKVSEVGALSHLLRSPHLSGDQSYRRQSHEESGTTRMARCEPASASGALSSGAVGASHERRCT